MKNMLSRGTVFARPLCRYGTQHGPVSVFMHEQVKHFCIIRSDLTGQILGIAIGVRPSEDIVQNEIDHEATPRLNDRFFRIPRRPGRMLFRTQYDVDNDY